jgi:hypothetical protein
MNIIHLLIILGKIPYKVQFLHKRFPRLDRICNKDKRAELNIYSINEKITDYQNRWKDHINRMEDHRLLKQIRKYKPKGKRDVGRPMKRCD